MCCCDVFPSSIGISGGFGVLEPQIHHLSFLGPKMAFSSSQNTTFEEKMANFEANITVKQGKKRQKDKWYPIHACTPPPLNYVGMQAALGNPRPGTECSRALRARNPKRVRKESASLRVSRGLRPRRAQRAQILKNFKIFLRTLSY